MANVFKKVGSIFGIGGDEGSQAARSSVLNVAAPAPVSATELPSQKAKPKAPTPDDKKVELAQRRKVQKQYAGRGRSGSVLGSGGDETYG